MILNFPIDSRKNINLKPFLRYYRQMKSNITIFSKLKNHMKIRRVFECINGSDNDLNYCFSIYSSNLPPVSRLGGSTSRLDSDRYFYYYHYSSYYTNTTLVLHAFTNIFLSFFPFLLPLDQNLLLPLEL